MIRRKSFFTSIVVVILILFFMPRNLASLVFANNDEIGSTIGGIQVSHIKEKELQSVLHEAVENWKQEPIVISGAWKQLIIDSSQIVFDIGSTIAQLKELTDYSWFAFWEPKRNVQLPLQVTISERLTKNRKSKRQFLLFCFIRTTSN